MAHPRVTSGLQSFYADHPLTFLSRRPSDQKLTNAPPTLTHLRDLLRSPTYQPATSEQAFAKQSLAQIYLTATGNFDPFVPSDGSLALGVSGDSFGFLKELNPEHAAEVVSLTKEEVATASFHKLMRFCVLHGGRVGHDTTRPELVAMANWILASEGDKVSLRGMATMMQEAIDLAALAQNVEQFDELHSKDKIEAQAKAGLQAAEETAAQLERAQSEAIAICEAGRNVGTRKPIVGFEYKVLHALEESREKRAQRRGGGKPQ